eukprot:Opistho-2@6359
MALLSLTPFAAIAETAEGFRGRIDDLKNLIALRNCSDNGALHTNEYLVNLTVLVSELESQAAMLASMLAAERAALANAEALIPLAHAQRELLDHMEQNLPRHIPGNRTGQSKQVNNTAKEGTDSEAAGARQHHPASNSRGISSILGDKAKESSAGQGSGPTAAKSAKDIVASQLPKLDYVTVDEFESVPKYMRGRMKREAVNQAIDAIHAAIASKYKIIATPRRQLGEAVLKKLKEYRAAENEETAREFFFVEEDLRGEGSAGAAGAKAGDVVNKTHLTVLRHLGRLRENRGGGYLRHVLSK